jgi:lipoyl(octanoyl) transferase
VTWHGFALNVNTDLSYFDLIVPCGIAGVDMTSMRRQLGVSFIEMSLVESTIAQAFARVFDLAAVDVPLSALELTLGEGVSNDR